MNLLSEQLEKIETNFQKGDFSHLFSILKETEKIIKNLNNDIREYSRKIKDLNEKNFLKVLKLIFI